MSDLREKEREKETYFQLDPRMGKNPLRAIFSAKQRHCAEKYYLSVSTKSE